MALRRSHCKRGHDLSIVGRCMSASGQSQGCRQCRNENQRLYRKVTGHARRLELARVGWTTEQYDQVWAQQEQRCAVCNRMQADHEKAFAADHDHQTMKTRGILCFSCNTALGHFGESIEVLQSAIRYLKRFK